MIRQFNVSLDREAFFEDEHAKHKNSLTPIIKSAHFDKVCQELLEHFAMIARCSDFYSFLFLFLSFSHSLFSINVD